MPAQRLPWVKLWLSTRIVAKTAMLPDGLFKSWTFLLMAAAEQPERGRFLSAEHAAQCSGRPLAHVKELIARRLLDQREDGLWMHDWGEHQDKHPSDFSRERSAKTPRNTPPNGPTKTPRTPGNDSVQEERGKKRELETEKDVVPPAANAASPEGAAVSKVVPISAAVEIPEAIREAAHVLEQELGFHARPTQWKRLHDRHPRRDHVRIAEYVAWWVEHRSENGKCTWSIVQKAWDMGWGLTANQRNGQYDDPLPEPITLDVTLVDDGPPPVLTMPSGPDLPSRVDCPECAAAVLMPPDHRTSCSLRGLHKFALWDVVQRQAVAS